MKTLYLDFETEAIGSRPHAYPPKPVGYAFIFGKRKEYISWGHPEENTHDYKTAKLILQQLFMEADEVICHHTQFDRDVCETFMELWHRNWGCTMTLAFLADPYGQLSLKPLAAQHLNMPPEEQDKLADWIVANVPGATRKNAGAYICKAPAGLVKPYAIGDVVRTKGLHEKWKKLTEGDAYKREMRLLGPVLDIERKGIRLDAAALEADTEQAYVELEKLDVWLSKRLGGVDMDADQAVAAALEAKGLLTQPLDITEKGAVSVNKKSLIAAVGNKEVLGRMLLRNALATCVRSFMSTWLEQSKANKGRLYFKVSPVRSEYMTGAKTGRLSSTPSIMNLPSDFVNLYETLEGIRFKYPYQLPNLRKYILPDVGHILVSSDLSQIEMRVFAHFEDGVLMEAYKTDPNIDAHDMVAKLSGLTRKQAKTLDFAALYGAGIGVIMSQLDCTDSEARQFKAQYNATFPGVKALNQSIEHTIRSGQPITTIGGRDYYCEAPKYVQGRMRTFEYKMINYLCQASAADIFKEAMSNYWYSPQRKGHMSMMVHDQVVCSVPKSHAKHEAKLIEQCMTTALADCLDVPLRASISMGGSYAEV